MDIPFYYPLSKENTPQFISEDKLFEANVIIGNLLGIKGPIPTMTAINSATQHIAKNGKQFIALPKKHHAFLYLLDGKLLIGDNTEVSGFNMAVLETD